MGLNDAFIYREYLVRTAENIVYIFYLTKTEMKHSIL